MSKEKEEAAAKAADEAKVIQDNLDTDKKSPDEEKAIQENFDSDKKSADVAKVIQANLESEQKIVDEAKVIQDKLDADKKAADVVKSSKKDTVKIKFLLSPAGLFFLPWNVGDIVPMDKLQAQEIVDAKYAEYVK